MKSWMLPVCAAMIVGCGQAPEAKFVLNKPTDELMPIAKQGVIAALSENFGTPHALIAWQKLPVHYGDAGEKVSGLNEADTKDAGWDLKLGRNLYMKHCLHCHGVSGDGNGPTAQYLNPRPRDYRQGVFKFTSTTSTSKVSRGDLMRTLQEGIPGTTMPSFVLLKPYELESIVEYVRWLSMRGEYEKRIVGELAGDYSDKAFKDRQAAGEKSKEIIDGLKKLLQGEGGAEPEFNATKTEVGSGLAGDWEAPEDDANVIYAKVKRTEPTAESIARGRALFMSEKAKCYTCHGLGGKGDGQSTVDYWAIPGSTPERKYGERGLHDTWGNPQKPRNLTLGQYRGGRRPIDLYRRIYAGIKGTQMAGFGGTVFNDQEMWDIVNYVMSIPYNAEIPAPAVLQAETR